MLFRSLGKGILAYATRYYSSTAFLLVQVVEDMRDISEILSGQGFTVLRQKVELVVYDTKVK